MSALRLEPDLDWARDGLPSFFCCESQQAASASTPEPNVWLAAGSEWGVKAASGDPLEASENRPWAGTLFEASLAGVLKIRR